MLIAERFPPVCDFCSDEHITRDFSCKTFEFPDPRLGWGSTGDWAACDKCAAMVDAEKWDELLDRAMTQYGELPPEHFAAIRERVALLHQLFNQNRPVKG
jgi:hypothetical protein